MEENGDKFLICENCKQVVARFHPDHVSMPISSNMFRAKHDRKGDRPFWAINMEARYMKCPICPKRVFNSPVPERLRTSDSMDGAAPYWFVPTAFGSQDHGN